VTSTCSNIETEISRTRSYKHRATVTDRESKRNRECKKKKR